MKSFQKTKTSKSSLDQETYDWLSHRGKYSIGTFKPSIPLESAIPPSSSQNSLLIKRSIQKVTFRDTENYFVSLQGVELQYQPTPEKIICLDIDGTIFDYEKSKQSNTTIILNRDRLRTTLQHAKKNNISIILITSRTIDSNFEVQFNDSPLSIPNIVKAIGEEYFDMIFLTNTQRKAKTLKLLFKHFFNDDLTKKQQILLLDNSTAEVNECYQLGFPAVLADDTLDYLDEADGFIFQDDEIYKASIIALQEDIKKGDVDSLYCLADYYETGRGVPRDCKKSIELYQKAADKGHTGALNALGLSYISGKGVPQDKAKGLMYITQSAEMDQNEWALKNLCTLLNHKEYYDFLIDYFLTKQITAWPKNMPLDSKEHPAHPYPKIKDQLRSIFECNKAKEMIATLTVYRK